MNQNNHTGPGSGMELPKHNIQITSPDGPVHKFYGVIREKHFHHRLFSNEQERDIKESFFFGFHAAMEFLGKKIQMLDDSQATALIREIQGDVDSVIRPAKERSKKRIILPGSN